MNRMPHLCVYRRIDGSLPLAAAATWKAQLPNTILGVFTLPESNPGHRERARNVHQTFLTEYGLTAEQVPMLMYDKSRCACYDRTSGCSCEGPFVLFEGG